jgi:type VI secretion system secreted protein Hcp
MAFDAFLKIAGLDGETSDELNAGATELKGYQWRVDQPRSASASSVGSLSAERANFGEFIAIMPTSKITPKLAQACASGEHYGNLTLTLYRAGGDKQPYMEYKLTDVMVTSFSAGGVSTDEEKVPTESVSFSYGQIELKYTQTKVAGGKGSGNVAAGWDLKANKKI